jgi:hypothetical protein
LKKKLAAEDRANCAENRNSIVVSIRRRCIGRKGYLAVFAAAVLTLVVTADLASAAVPKSHYWTTTRAAALVKANAKIPCAKLQPNPNHLPPAASCANQPPSSIAGTTVTCAGQGAPLKGTQRFNRFLCQWADANHVTWGSLLVYVSGPSTFRWRVIS